jgi:hypothetical protein
MSFHSRIFIPNDCSNPEMSNTVENGMKPATSDTWIGANGGRIAVRFVSWAS